MSAKIFSHLIANTQHGETLLEKRLVLPRRRDLLSVHCVPDSNEIFLNVVHIDESGRPEDTQEAVYFYVVGNIQEVPLHVGKFLGTVLDARHRAYHVFAQI